MIIIGGDKKDAEEFLRRIEKIEYLVRVAMWKSSHKTNKDILFGVINSLYNDMDKYFKNISYFSEDSFAEKLNQKIIKSLEK